MQFHWQFLIINSSFWLVGFILWKFDTSSKTEMKTIKKHQKFFGEKQQKKCQESISSILYYELTPLIHDVTCYKLKK